MKQIVLLGAGFDSRPYRFQKEIENTKIFEVDELKTQEYKRMILQSNGVDCDKNIKYVPVDLEKDDIINELHRAGYNSELRSLFLWEGVTFYLYPDTVRSILRSLRSNSAEQSMISFDFQNIDQEQGLINTGLKDEAIHFGIKAETVSEYLKTLGYSVIEHIGSEEMVKRYLTCSDGSQIGNIKSIMHIVKAQMA
jgi:methyltransferase (TIGR00027 family)